MNDSSIISNLFKDNYEIIISIVTIEELDNLKDNKERYEQSKQARHAIRAIENFSASITFDLTRDIYTGLVEMSNGLNKFNTNDDIIVSCAKANDACIITDDLNLKVKAKAIGVETLEYRNFSMYKGYVEYAFTTEEYNDYWEQKEKYFVDYYINEYIIIERLDDIDNNGNTKFCEYRFNGKDLVTLNLPSSRIVKARNSLQRCALDMLNNNDIKVCSVLGTMGSGKTFLSFTMAYNAIKSTGKQDKIIGIRSPIGTGKSIGFLKGDFEDKTGAFFAPLSDSLDGKEYELQGMQDKGQLETNIPYYCKGRTFNSTILMADEAEDFTEQEIKLIGTRLGQDSRIFFSGDYKQSEINKSNSNPLVKMCEELKGNPMFACIYLQDDERSEASKLFATLFE